MSGGPHTIKTTILLEDGRTLRLRSDWHEDTGWELVDADGATGHPLTVAEAMTVSQDESGKALLMSQRLVRRLRRTLDSRIAAEATDPGTLSLLYSSVATLAAEIDAVMEEETGGVELI